MENIKQVVKHIETELKNSDYEIFKGYGMASGLWAFSDSNDFVSVWFNEDDLRACINPNLDSLIEQLDLLKSIS